MEVQKLSQITLLKRERWKISNNVVHTSSNAHIVGKRMQRLRNNWQVDNLCTVVNHVNVFQSPESEILPTCEFNLTLSRFNFVKSQRREEGRQGATNLELAGRQQACRRKRRFIHQRKKAICATGPIPHSECPRGSLGAGRKVGAHAARWHHWAPNLGLY